MSFDGGEYGEGILSKYSFLSTKNYTLKAQKGKEPRAALETNILLKSGETVKFIGTHLDHTKEEIDRINQANQLNSLFAKGDSPIILAGDLNAKPKSKTIKTLLKYWSSSFSNSTPTYPATKAKYKIDYILFYPKHKWRVLETKVICNDKVTDHCAILSVLELL